MGAFIAGLIGYVVAIIVVIGVYEYRCAKYRKVITEQHKVIYTLFKTIIGIAEKSDEADNEEAKETETQDAGK